jgi:hypothetical protein
MKTSSAQCSTHAIPLLFLISIFTGKSFALVMVIVPKVQMAHANDLHIIQYTAYLFACTATSGQ